MSRIFKQKEVSIKPKILCTDSPPKRLIYNENEPAKILLENGDNIIGSCLNCPDTPCLKYNEEELSNSSFPLFPQDNILNVCPTEAITLDTDTGSPTVEPDRCIACGICASRCPSGAIYFEKKITELTLKAESKKQHTFEETVAKVNTSPNDYLKDVTESSFYKAIDKVNSTQSLLLSLPRDGSFIKESEEVFEPVYNKIVNLKVDAQFPNLLTRNLLIETGVSCSIRRKGDVNLRMDAVLSFTDNQKGVVEVELAPIGILDSPRNMLDNIAVLNSRYNIEPKELIPLIISMSLPNSRTEFYRVIKDINKVLGIKINSLTIGALFILIWNNKRLNSSNFDFYIDSENISIREELQKILGKEINLTQGFFSILENSK